MNFKTQLLAVAAALLLASASGVDAAPAKLAKKARKNISAIVPETELRHTRIVGAEAEPIAEVNNFAGPVNALQSALDYANTRFTDEGLQERGYIVKNAYKTDHNGITHVYLRQVVNGLEVFNADMNINVMADGSILSAADNFFAGSSYPEIPSEDASSFVMQKSLLTPLEALQRFGNFIGEETVTKNFFGSTNVEEVKLDDEAALIRNVPYAESDVPAKLVYVQSNGELKLGWELTVEMSNNWFSTVVDASSGEVISVNDWVSQAVPTYRVLPWGVEDPSDGKLELVTESFEAESSPLGWHDDGKTKYTTTVGNNIDARSPSGSTNRRPDGGKDLQFLDTADFTQEAKTYYLAATTNMFHLSNRYHDLLYQLGFNEVAGNFQTDNFGKGGKGNDAVIANAQDPSGTNNANFATPADGSPGKMNMYIFTTTKPNRDGDYQAGIVIHEYSHGLSTRLTGGPANSNCLPSGESGGMGEGWGDIISTVIRQREEYTREKAFPQGGWVLNDYKKGVRKYAYSTDMSVDPETYGYLKKSGYSEVHTSGEVWAGILNEVYWNLREAKGFQKDIYKLDIKTAEARAKAKGNVIWLLNVVDAMKLQPCKPSFVDARDAIFAADKANFDGANTCLMWKGFAKRGLGVKAKAGGNEDFSVPAECN